MSDIDTERMMQGIDSPPPKKQCGTCKWWDKGNANAPFNGRNSAPCTMPLPFWVDVCSTINPWEDRGQDCAVYEERK